MHIIVIGGGKVGITLIEHLAKEGHDIVLIDNDPKVVESIINQFDIMAICGNGATCGILTEAGVAKTNLVISVTHSDELNILCCMVAKRMGARHTIARVRNPDYASQLYFMRNELGLSMMINPEFEAANEISRILRFPSAIKLDTFAKGRVELVEIKIAAGSPLSGMPLRALHGKYHVQVLVCAVQRGDEVFIPTGDFVLQEGDKIHITASHAELAAFFKELGIFKNKVKTVLIIGGGKIAFYLARQLCEMGMKVKIIEQDKQRCVELSEMLPKAMILQGDGTDQSLLLEEGLQQVDALVALTGIDEENIIVSIYACLKQVDKVVTKVNRNSFTDILESIGLESVIAPKNITANNIVRYVRAKQNSVGSSVQTLYKLVNDKVEALEFIVSDNSLLIGKTLKDLQLKDNLLVASIIRRGKLIFPRGSDTIEANDSVVVVTTNQFLRDLRDILR